MAKGRSWNDGTSSNPLSSVPNDLFCGFIVVDTTRSMDEKLWIKGMNLWDYVTSEARSRRCVKFGCLRYNGRGTGDVIYDERQTWTKYRTRLRYKTDVFEEVSYTNSFPFLCYTVILVISFWINMYKFYDYGKQRLIWKYLLKMDINYRW